MKNESNKHPHTLHPRPFFKYFQYHMSSLSILPLPTGQNLSKRQSPGQVQQWVILEGRYAQTYPNAFIVPLHMGDNAFSPDSRNKLRMISVLREIIQSRKKTEGQDTHLTCNGNDRRVHKRDGGVEEIRPSIVRHSLQQLRILAQEHLKQPTDPFKECQRRKHPPQPRIAAVPHLHSHHGCPHHQKRREQIAHAVQPAAPCIDAPRRRCRHLGHLPRRRLLLRRHRRHLRHLHLQRHLLHYLLHRLHPSITVQTKNVSTLTNLLAK